MLTNLFGEARMEKQKDLEIVRLMIGMYCRGRHKTKKGELCSDCAELAAYVEQRRERCPFGDDKPFCSNCKIHCYKSEMRERIKAVMRYSGPRMMFYNPKIAWAHVFETLRRKREEKKIKAKEKQNGKKEEQK